MTLIAATMNYGFPIIIGDLLATSDQVANDLIIPVFSKSMSEYLSSKYLPVELIQKIHIISDVIVAGFAGSIYQIKLLLNDLIDYFKYKESTLSELENFIANNIDYDKFKESSGFIIFYDKSTNEIHNLFINRGDFLFADENKYQHSFAGGSGAEAFLKILKNEIFAIPEKTSNLTQAIARNYLLLGNALHSELSDLRTLNNHWGGGFEMIYYDGNKFVRMDNITYLFWLGRIDLESGIYAMREAIIYNLKYKENLLVLGVYRIETNDEPSLLTTHIVSPLYRKVTESEDHTIHNSHKIDVDNSRICNVFSFLLSNKQIRYTYKFEVSENLLGLPPGSFIPVEGHEYMYPNGLHEPSTVIKFNYLNDKIHTVEVNLKPDFLDYVMKGLEKNLISIFKLKSFRLIRTSFALYQTLNKELVTNVVMLKEAGLTNTDIATLLNIPFEQVVNIISS